MSRSVLIALILCLSLAACGKSSRPSQQGADPCASAKGVPPYETDAQAIQACRDNKVFSGADTKRSHIQITNH